MPRSRITEQERRRQIWKKTNGRCAHCGKIVYGTSQTVDHFIPRSLGGGFDRRNLMPLCRACNMKRMNEIVDPESFYSYADDVAISQCLCYQREWLLSRTCVDGTRWGWN